MKELSAFRVVLAHPEQIQHSRPYYGLDSNHVQAEVSETFSIVPFRLGFSFSGELNRSLSRNAKQEFEYGERQSGFDTKHQSTKSAAGRTARGGHGGAVGVAHGVEGPAQREVLRRLAVLRVYLPPNLVTYKKMHPPRTLP